MYWSRYDYRTVMQMIVSAGTAMIVLHMKTGITRNMKISFDVRILYERFVL